MEINGSDSFKAKVLRALALLDATSDGSYVRAKLAGIREGANLVPGVGAFALVRERIAVVNSFYLGS
jgi:hypothetical protein